MVRFGANKYTNVALWYWLVPSKIWVRYFFVAWMFTAIEQPLVFIWSEKKIAQFLIVSKGIEKTTMRIKMKQKFFCHSNVKHPTLQQYSHANELQNLGYPWRSSQFCSTLPQQAGNMADYNVSVECWQQHCHSCSCPKHAVNISSNSSNV